MRTITNTTTATTIRQCGSPEFGPMGKRVGLNRPGANRFGLGCCDERGVPLEVAKDNFIPAILSMEESDTCVI